MTCLLLAALAAVALTGCDAAEDPLPVGTFSVEVTGDVAGSAAGTAFVVEPDSGFNAGDMMYEAHIPIALGTTSGDPVGVFSTVFEPTEPNGSFTEIPDGTFPFVSGSPDLTRPVPFPSVRAEGMLVGANGGAATPRRRPDGTVEGHVRARYVAGAFGPTLRGSIDLRFTARPR